MFIIYFVIKYATVTLALSRLSDVCVLSKHISLTYGKMHISAQDYLVSLSSRPVKTHAADCCVTGCM